MISTLINLLGSFYERKEFTKAEAIARNMHTAIPGDRVSLKFLGLVYYRTGRINEAIRLFDQLERQPNLCAEKQASAPADSGGRGLRARSHAARSLSGTGPGTTSATRCLEAEEIPAVPEFVVRAPGAGLTPDQGRSPQRRLLDGSDSLHTSDKALQGG